MHRLQAILIALMVFMIVVSAMLVNATRTVWDDFLLVIVALLVHSPLERYSERIWEWARATAPGVGRSILFERNKSRQR